MNFLRIALLTTPAVSLLVTAPALSAPLVQYEVIATVDFVNDPLNLLGGSIQPDDTLTGFVQYDLALADQDPSSAFGFYDGVPLSANFISGANETSDFFVTELFFDVAIENDVVDRVEMFASGDTIPSTLAAPNVDFVDLQVVLVDVDGTALSSDALPDNLNVADYEVAVVYFSAESSGPTPQIIYEVEAIISSISRTIVPEPHALAFLVLGVVPAVVRRSRRTTA